MNAVELKSNIHNIINKIDNEELLQSLYDFLKVKEGSSAGSLWKELTENQKAEVLLSYEESKNKENLISREDLFTPDK